MLVNNQFFKSVAAIVLLIVLFWVSQNCFAETNSQESKMLKGNVKGAALRTEDGLVKIDETATLVKETSTNIVKEATRKDTVVFRGPNYIGSGANGIVLPPIGGDGGVMRFGDLPIRRRNLDAFVQHTELALQSLNSQIEALIIPDEWSSQSSETWSNIKTEHEIAINHLTKLKELAAAKKLVNKEIGREALAIYDAMVNISKLSNSLLEQISSSK